MGNAWGAMEVNMVLRVPAAALAALTGAVMLAGSSGPSAAFTLSSPSLSQPVLSADVEKAWWDRWGRWHPNWGWRRPWWGPHYRAYYWGPYHHPWRHCWWTYWGRRCAW